VRVWLDGLASAVGRGSVRAVVGGAPSEPWWARLRASRGWRVVLGSGGAARLSSPKSSPYPETLYRRIPINHLDGVTSLYVSLYVIFTRDLAAAQMPRR
jgi:hypothetical protein